MRAPTLVLLVTTLLLASAGTALARPAEETARPNRQPEHHLLQADDEVLVHAYRYAPERITRDLVVLAFHQAQGDARGEYAPIAARLNELGYEVFAVDQRSGGERFGGPNQTVRDLGRSTGYCEAMADLEAAYSYLRSIRPGRSVVVFGSSYSAALALRLATQNPPDLAGVVPFSPASGGPLEDCRGEEVSGEIDAPVLVFRPASEMEIDSVQEQAKLFEDQGHEVFVADPAVHGASMLVAERVDARVEATWSRLLLFLREIEAARAD